jgi:molecular chaperone DnaK
MNNHRVILIVSLLITGCITGKGPLVIEDHPPIINGNVTTETLGIETLAGRFTPLIAAGTPIPCSVSKTFSTASDSQSQIILKLFRGSNIMVSKNHLLGRFQIVGIPPTPRGVPSVQVTFKIDREKITLAAQDLKSKRDLIIKAIQ